MQYFHKCFIKRFKKGFSSINGRNFSGRICINGRGGGIRKNILKLDFCRRLNCFGFVIQFLKVFDFSKKYAIILYDSGLTALIIASKEIIFESRIYSGIPYNLEFYVDSSAFPLENHILFTQISCLETMPFKGLNFSRACGVSSIIVNKFGSYNEIKTKSGWKLNLQGKCLGMLGEISGPFNNFIMRAKAGKSRLLGFKPKVRGVAKNPCDHPHGGGNGKKSPPVVPVTAYGKPAKWTPTLNKKFMRERRFNFKTFITKK